MGRAPRPEHARLLLHQRQRPVLLRDVEPQARADDARVHAERQLRRPAAPARHPQAPDLAGRAPALHRRRPPRARLGAARGDVVGPGEGVEPLPAAQGDPRGHGRRGPRARPRRLRPGRPGRQDHRHLHRQRRAPREAQGQGRRDGGRRFAVPVRPRDRAQPPGRHDHRGDGQAARGAPRGRLPGDPHPAGGGAADPLPQRLQARQPLRLRHPPALAGVLQEGQADRAALPGVAADLHGHAREGDGLHAALRLLEGDRHQVPHRRGGRGLAHLRGRNAEGDHEPRPGVHVPPPAGRREDRQAAGRADHGPGRLHQGRGRRGRHRREARAAADHHRQQLQRLRRALGGARRAPAPAAPPRAEARRRRSR